LTAQRSQAELRCPDDECEHLVQGVHLTSPHGEAVGISNYLKRRVRHINNNTACIAAVRSRWGNPESSSKWPISIDARSLDIGKPPDEQRSMRVTNPRIRERSTVV
jgi:hypothetical protein